MKLYVIPVQNKCNANCLFCITKYRQEKNWGEMLELDNLEKIKNLAIDKIEITGGGEPLLHPKINEIINRLSQRAWTQIYTNGGLINVLNENTFKKLGKVCISQAHYNRSVNHKIMNMLRDDYRIKDISQKVKIKMSAVMCQSGINSQLDITKYVKWAISLGAKEVVLRRMFEFDYPKKINNEIEIDLITVVKEMKQLYKVIKEDENRINFWMFGIPVEIEFRSCACELSNLVLRPNGKIYVGWGKNEYQGNS